MPRPLRKIKKLSLYKALKVGYLRNEKKQAKRMKRFGYIVDKDLTNNERMVAYNPTTRKVVFVENGSSVNPFSPQFYEDWQNNIQNVTTGTFEYTPRFQAAKSAYLKTKQKYEAPVTLVGHSQSAITVNDLTGKNDKGYTLNGALIKQKDNPHVTNYRIKNDIVSALSNPNDMRTLQGESKNPFVSHAIDNIRNEPIFL
jgi:hypothetical protein